MQSEYTPEFIARFWSRVDKTSSPHGCWLWTRATTNGYGVVWSNGSLRYAHRVAYELLSGPIPEGMNLCHDCPGGDNPACVLHTFPGSQMVNVQDAIGKGKKWGAPRGSGTGERNGKHTHPERAPRGTLVPNAKLSDEAVRMIRRASLDGASNQYELAARFGVNQSTIWKILHGKAWAHVI
jgi:hypothetical protein